MIAKLRSTLRVVVAIAVVALVGCTAPENAQPDCQPGPPTTLMAESVPTAAFIPCVRELPSGWAFEGFEANERAASFTLESDATGGSVEVVLQRRCTTADQQPMSSRRARIRQWQSRSAEGSTTVWTAVFDGGCARTRIDLPSGSTEDTAASVRAAIGFVPRRVLVALSAPS